MRDFIPFNKIARLNRDIIITEKIDGTNAQIYITPKQTGDSGYVSEWYENGAEMVMYAGSRTRWVTLDSDNYGFAKWLSDNADELRKLGPGSHFGEWWGLGIQRNYGLREKVFSLFNVDRWNKSNVPACCDIVPVLYEGPFCEEAIKNSLSFLREGGSVAAKGFPKPEGIVIFHVQGQKLFKITLEKDDEHKTIKEKK
jgi:hypothetical protein